MPPYPSFIGGSSTVESTFSSQERTVNWYIEKSQSPGATSEYSLYPCPGVSLFATGTSGGGRAHLFTQGREFAVIGSDFLEIGQFGSVTSRGTVSTDGNPATISTNGISGGQLFITSGTNGYLFTLATNVFAAIASIAGICTMGDQLDGYFLAMNSAASSVRISDLNDGATWDPLQVIQRSIESDPWVSMRVANRYIYFFGSRTTETWFDAGSYPIPFEPHPAGLMQYGCAAPFSPKVVGPSICWLGATANGQGVVLKTSGFTPDEISTYATHWAMENYTTLGDCIGDTYEALGHTFLQLNFPTARATWAWDSQLNIWHERGTWDDVGMEFTTWRPLYHAFAFGEHRVLDSQNSNIYRLSHTYGLDVDELPIRRLRRAPALVNNNDLMYYSNFELDLEVGLGAVSGQGVDPEIMLRMSNDNGKTWSSESQRSSGALGNYSARAIWSRCGAGRRRVFEVSVSDPVPWRIVNAYVDAKPGRKK